MMRPPWRRSGWGAAIAASMYFLGWVAVNVLTAAGTLLLLGFAIGSFTLPGMLLQLANLADRYAAADAVRRGAFDLVVIKGAVLIFAIVCLLRRGSLFRIFTVERDDDV